MFFIQEFNHFIELKVTGAGHGIGRELALRYASEGSILVLWDINEKNNEETARLINENGGPRPFSYVYAFLFKITIIVDQRLL